MKYGDAPAGLISHSFLIRITSPSVFISDYCMVALLIEMVSLEKKL